MMGRGRKGVRVREREGEGKRRKEEGGRWLEKDIKPLLLCCFQLKCLSKVKMVKQKLRLMDSWSEIRRECPCQLTTDSSRTALPYLVTCLTEQDQWQEIKLKTHQSSHCLSLQVSV